MKKFDISCDSNCDFYATEVAEFGLYVGRLNYTLTTKQGQITEYIDDFKSESDYFEFYDKMRNGIIAKTSILSENAHVELFTQMAKDGVKSALHVCQSYGLSPTLDRAKSAYEIVKKDYPDLDIVFVESSTTTIGEQMLVRKAIEMRDAGFSAQETADKINSLRMHIQHYVMVSDLMYLKRGGRISGPKAMIGSLLKVRPIIEFTKEGKLDIIRKEMGEKKAVSSIIEEGLKMGKHPDSFQIFIGHTGNVELAEKLKERLKEAFGVDVQIRLIGAIIGAHLGPDAVAYAFISEKERQY